MESNSDFDTIPSGYLVINEQGSIREVNTYVLNLLDYSKDDLIDQPFEQILTVAAKIFFHTHLITTILHRGIANEIYLSLRSSSDIHIPVLLNAKLIGKTKDIVFTMIPIQNRNQYEDEIIIAKRAAEEATIAKDRFVALVSHELRSPLTAILGWAELLKEGRVPECDLKVAYESIETSALSQSRLVEDLLDIGRIVSGTLSITPEYTDVQTIAESSLKVVHLTALDKNIQIVTEIPNESIPIYADPARLQQAIVNLLNNAIKFSPNGEEVKLIILSQNTTVIIQVSDNGRGIPQEFMPKIFNQFAQQEDIIKRRESGLGLGLAITKHLVDLHHGSISVASEGDQKGATFTIELPLFSESKIEKLESLSLI